MPTNNAVTRWLAARILRRAERIVATRDPDFYVGGRNDPYLRRWWLIPRNPIFNVYLHDFVKDDEDRAPHCHPWISLSLVLSGPMREIYLERTRTLDGTIVTERRRTVGAGDLIYRPARFAHRMVIPHPGSLTLFMTGPRIREWYFWCDNKRPVHWKAFVDDRDRGLVGRGCE